MASNAQTPKRTGSKARRGWRTLLPLRRYVRPYRWGLTLAVVGLVAGSVLGFLNLLLLKPAVEVLGGAARPQPAVERQLARPDGALRAVERRWERLVAPLQSRLEAADASFQRYAASNRRGALWLVAVAMLGLAALKSVIESLCQYLLARSSYGMVADLHEDLFRKVIAQDYLYFVRHSTGYLESRIQSDVAALRRTLETLLRHGFQAPFQILFLGILLLALNPQLTLIALAVALPAAVALLSLSRVVRRVIRETRRQADRQGAALEESLRNFPLVKFFQSEPFEIEKFAQRNRQLLRSYLKNRLAQFGSAPLTQLVSAAGRSAVLIVGGYLVFGGRMEFSTLVVYLVALTRFYGPGRSLSRAGGTWPTLIVSAERMAEILRLEPAVSEAQDAQPLDRVREGIEFRNVSFSYAAVGQIGNLPSSNPSQVDNLRHVSLDQLVRFGFLDSALGGATGDFAAVATVGRDEHGYLYLLDVWMERASPSRQIEKIFDLHEWWNYRLFGFEANCFQSLLAQPIEEERRRRREAGRPWDLPIEQITHRENKMRRIASLETLITNGWLLFSRELSEEFFQQCEQFPRGAHDDGLDALESAVAMARRATIGRASPAGSKRSANQLRTF